MATLTGVGVIIQGIVIIINLSLKKNTLFVLYLFVILVSCSFQNAYGQSTGLKYIENYSQEEYGEHSQNWSVLQDKRGIIYVGNQTGLLEFDGATWRALEIPNQSVRSMAIDDGGTIYIGGDNEFGLLVPDEKGTLKYKSLREHLNDKEINFSTVWRTHSTKEGIYFWTTEFLFRWHKGILKPVPPFKAEYNFRAFFYCGGKLYIRHNEIGLVQVKDDSLEPVPGGRKFGDKGIFMMAQYDLDSNKLLIGTRDDGFYIYDGTKVEPFPLEDGGYVQTNKLYHGIRLFSSGDFALATLRGGLVIIDAGGRLKDIYTTAHGLQDDDVKYVFEDSRGNLWLALSKGISKIEYNSPISIYNERSNLPGLVQSVTRHGPHDDLYAGTTKGLYLLESGSRFRNITGVDANCFSLLSTGDSLLAATGEGVFQVRPRQNTVRQLITDYAYTLLRSEIDTNRVWVGTREGLTALYLNPGNGSRQWEKEYQFTLDNKEIRTIVEDRRNGNLWLGTQSTGVIKIDLQPKGKITEDHVTEFNQMPVKGANVFRAAEKVIFAPGDGIYIFNEKTGRFTPDLTLGSEFAGGQGQRVFRIAEDMNKDIWFNSGFKNVWARYRKDGDYELIKKPFLRIPHDQVNVIYPDPDGNTIWFGGNNGLIRFDRRMEKDYGQKFEVFVRRVETNGKPIYDGFKIKRTPHEIEFSDRNMRFEFASPYFENESATQYQCLLEGDEEKWSSWDTVPHKDYINLAPGMYTFRVRAQNTYDNLSPEAVFHFIILPPWYRTWWAYAIYALTISLLLFQFVRWRLGKLEREKRKLGRIVKERTNEIGEKNQQLQAQTLQLKEQAEKLQEMDKVKSRFFANISHEFRTPLTLIMGPLEHMLSDSTDPKAQRTLNLMLRNSQRLLGLINQLLELSKFESGKMKLKASRQNIVSFLKGIIAAFEPVTAKNEVGLEFHSEEEDITLYFDPEQLEEVIYNLLSNAVKFTPPGGRISAAVTKNPGNQDNFPSGSVDISVRDTGPGIPRDQLGHIFDRFYQSDITSEHHRKGSGIGLAIAREVVELHQGKIDVHSSEGMGTEFIIRLPMGKEHLENHQVVETAAPPSPRKSPPDIPPGVPADTGEATHEQTGDITADKTIETLEQDKNIILVVEDSADIRDYIRGSLEPAYTVLEARNGREGIQKAQDIIPDLIISDIMMPEVDGYVLCRELKNDVKTSHIPIILLTAKASEENIVEGLETGADDYVTKPFSTAILSARIKNLIDLRRHMQLTLNREMSLKPVKIPVSQIDKTFIKKMRQVIRENISDPDFNIEQLCKKLEMSQPTLYRKIHALTGESPTEFIRSYRLKRGAELLKNNFGSVLEVAFEVGFSSAAYFTKCFKNKFHQLPSTFQETKR